MTKEGHGRQKIDRSRTEMDRKRQKRTESCRKEQEIINFKRDRKEHEITTKKTERDKKVIKDTRKTRITEKRRQ